MMEMKGNLTEWEATLRAANYLGDHGVPDFKDIEIKSPEEQRELLKNESVWTGAENFGGKSGLVMIAGPNYNVVALQHDGTVVSEAENPVIFKALVQNGDDCIEDCNGNELLPQLCIVSEAFMKDTDFCGEPFIKPLGLFANGNIADFLDYYNQINNYVESSLKNQHGIRIGYDERDIVDFEYDELLSFKLCVCPVVNVSDFVNTVEKNDKYSILEYAPADESFGKGETRFLASLPDMPKTSLLVLDGDSYCFASKNYDVLSMQMDSKQSKSDGYER